MSFLSLVDLLEETDKLTDWYTLGVFPQNAVPKTWKTLKKDSLYRWTEALQNSAV